MVWRNVFSKAQPPNKSAARRALTRDPYPVDIPLSALLPLEVQHQVPQGPDVPEDELGSLAMKIHHCLGLRDLLKLPWPLCFTLLRLQHERGMRPLFIIRTAEALEDDLCESSTPLSLMTVGGHDDMGHTRVLRGYGVR